MSRTDICFTSTRRSHNLVNDTSYWKDDYHDTGIHKETRGVSESIQCNKIRNRNSNFNLAFYGKSNVITLRKNLDPDWDVKHDCINQFPTLSRAQQMQSMPIAIVGRNASRLNDPKSITNGMGNTNTGQIRLTANQFLASKVPMKQSSGVVF